jgi:glutathione synthase/RimK-type ligase-like ATP-grasp enzyme
MTDMTRIGTVELVDLPAQQVFGVPAKVDTGADSSSIWASDINEQAGVLSFVLFDKTSPLYSGQTVQSSEYQVTQVKNSFGATELRYKVPMKLTLGGRTVNANVTLSNRANNRYPLLVGRRTLKGRFVVDASIQLSKSTHSVLMLSTKRTKVTTKYAANISAASDRLEVTYASYDDLDYGMGMPGSHITLRATGQDIAGFDLVYFKTTSKYADVAAATARYLEKRRVPFIDEAIKHFPSTSKIYQYMLLEHSRTQVPRSFFVLPQVMAESFEVAVERVGLPFVLKDIHGNKGEYNYVIRNQRDFNKACKLTAKAGVQCIAQAFVPNDCDYRVLVLGKKIGLIIRRSRVDDSTHLNNTSQGAQAEIVPLTTLPPDVQKACLQAAKLVERQVAGVDMVMDKDTGKWYCLEVNDGPQLASGSFVSEKYKAVAAYLERKLA